MSKVIVFVLTAALALGAGWPTGAAPRTEADYLAAHVRDIGADGARVAFDPGFYRKRLLLLGEVHGLAAVQPLDLAIVRHLNAHVGLRVYVAEIDVAQAARFNAFLADGDEQALREVFTGWAAGSLQWANTDFYDKVVAIRRLNQGLPAHRRIRFAGVDQLQDPALARSFLGARLEGLDLSAWPQGAALRDRLATGGSASAEAMIADLQAVRESMAALPPAGVPTRRWRDIRAALLSLAGAPGQGREGRIAANIERLMAAPEMRGQKAYGLWGLFHVIQAQVSGASPMAYRLGRPGGPLSGEVGSILTLALNSQMMLPSAALPPAARETGRYTAVPYTMDSERAVMLNGVEPVGRAARGRASLIRLDGEGSPYRGSTLLTKTTGFYSQAQSFEIDASTSSPGGAVNYLLVVRDSPATRPFEAGSP